MKRITITPTGEQKIYHDYFKPIICTSDIDLPKQYNQGYNSFRFVGGEPELISNNIPVELKMETANYIFYENQIQVLRSNGTTVSGYFLITHNKGTGENKETFVFD